MASEKSQQPRNVDIQRFDIAVRWNRVGFPFEQWKLLDGLEEQGYVLTDTAGRNPPLGGRTEATGVVARKGHLYLSLDSTRPGIGVGGRDVREAITEFERLEAHLLEVLRFDSRANARFYECDVQGLIWTDKSPISAVRERNNDNLLLKGISDALGHPLAHFGYRFGSRESDPGSVDWYELLIEPSIRSPQRGLFAVLVFRRANWEDVRDVAAKSPELFADVARKLIGS